MLFYRFVKLCCIMPLVFTTDGNQYKEKPMTFDSAIQDNRKMFVTFRMEPGSLGPDGSEYIHEFCDFAQVQLQASASPYIIWSIVPRLDKTLTEIEFQVSSKKLTRSKASLYLNVFGENLDNFEELLEDNLEALINQYFGR